MNQFWNMNRFLNRIIQKAKKKAKGAIRAAVKKMVYFFFFIFRLLTFHVLRTFCRIRDFFLLLADLMMGIFSIYVLFPLIVIGWGIKEFALFIYPYGWLVIFSEILLICFGERLKLFLTGISWKNLRVQNFSIFLKKFWTDLLKRFLTGTPWKGGT